MSLDVYSKYSGCNLPRPNTLGCHSDCHFRITEGLSQTKYFVPVEKICAGNFCVYSIRPAAGNIAMGNHIWTAIFRKIVDRCCLQVLLGKFGAKNRKNATKFRRLVNMKQLVGDVAEEIKFFSTFHEEL